MQMPPEWTPFLRSR